MKSDIHPKYGPVTIRCACGNTIETKSTRETIMVDACSACHPFFTGKQKLMDMGGRIDRFQKRYSGKVVAGQKAAKKSKAIISFEPTVQKAPERAAPAAGERPAHKKEAPKARTPKS